MSGAHSLDKASTALGRNDTPELVQSWWGGGLRQ